MDGLSVIEQIREHIQSGIIVVSARDKENDKIFALDHGADDYLNKTIQCTRTLGADSGKSSSSIHYDHGKC